MEACRASTEWIRRAVVRMVLSAISAGAPTLVRANAGVLEPLGQRLERRIVIERVEGAAPR